MFNFGKKNKENSACCCNGVCEVKEVETISGEIKKVKVLGTGCASCHKQYNNAKEAVKKLNLDVEVGVYNRC